MILLPSLLILAAQSVRVDVVGEGKLRFAAGRAVAYAGHATLARNAAGLLADETGRPLVPQIALPAGALAVGMGGKVTAGGRLVGQIVLERPGAGGDFGFPGTGTFGLLRTTLSSVPSGQRGTSSNPAARPLVQIHPRSEIVGDRVSLADVAEVSGDPATVARLKAVDLGTTPLLGNGRTLMKYSVLAALRDQGFPEGKVEIQIPPQAEIFRAGQTIDARRILDEATKAIDPKAKGGDIPFDIGPRSLVAEPGEVTFVSTEKRANDRVEVTLGILVAGKPAGERVVRFTLKREGVRIGEAVRVSVAMNGAVVETDAKAKTSGTVGETIQIVTAEGTTLTATVVASGRVEVKL